ncbi:STAS/SEC14 domain-containing protein [Vibrio azureus]|uniref:STAS/SEC14 domain-containing protein n=1 Tax=Vibrio azureus NBRC 104587 TaxID=1219077 RepID=U3AUU6_9VIBR|nr:STAS/SEC14 domain-containing protein [Vibrio azureus]AUI88542.1 STAS/SEC14 domain-containing protein [Vibrio azureus]GAD77022.1 hypothetical protein VAZ01S_058_00120 [Vibrio azureus NBRC 104587]
MQSHGITFGIERIDSQVVLVFKAKGKLTHQDYETIGPILEASLKGVHSNNIRMLADITELEGWEPRAAWDDFKLGMKTDFKVHRLAIYGHKNWQELAAKVSRWFIAGDAQSFDDYHAAMEWLAIRSNLD